MTPVIIIIVLFLSFGGGVIVGEGGESFSLTFRRFGIVSLEILEMWFVLL
jgi:hypothetical protein